MALRVVPLPACLDPRLPPVRGRPTGLMDGRFFAYFRLDFIHVVFEWCLRSDLAFWDQCFSKKMHQTLGADSWTSPSLYHA